MTTPSPSLEILVSRTEEGLSLSVRGEIDLSNVEVLEDAVNAAVDSDCLLVDLSRTTFVDVRGLTALARCSKRRAAIGRKLTVLDPPPVGEKILRSTSLGECLRWRRERR